MVEFTFWDIARQLLLALRWTVGLSLIAFVCGGLLGLGLLVLRLSKLPGAVRGVSLYVQLFQGTPLLMQLFLTYFGMALIGIETSALMAAAVCLTLYSAAYLCDIWRGCVEAVPHGQWEASSCLAMSFTEQLRHVILPQAFKRVLPPLAGQFISLVKDTSLVSVIAITELTKSGREAITTSFSTFEIWFCVAGLYLLINLPLSHIASRLERRLAQSD